MVLNGKITFRVKLIFTTATEQVNCFKCLHTRTKSITVKIEIATEQW